ncbi:hypothetical protein TNCV_4129791 [Trichonephila clavipes]|nr:hypothetical protein TNCV_4129791 [Trichonephila clavipes]
MLSPRDSPRSMIAGILLRCVGIIVGLDGAEMTSPLLLAKLKRAIPGPEFRFELFQDPCLALKSPNYKRTLKWWSGASHHLLTRSHFTNLTRGLTARQLFRVPPCH